MKAKIFLTALVLALSASFASAQTPETKEKANKSCYVDNDKNGVCDKFEDKTCTRGNGKGLQDGSGKRQGDGKNLRDGSGRKAGKGKGMRQGKRDGSGKNNGGKGTGFVDANNNGICDNKE